MNYWVGQKDLIQKSEIEEVLSKVYSVNQILRREELILYGKEYSSKRRVGCVNPTSRSQFPIDLMNLPITTFPGRIHLGHLNYMLLNISGISSIAVFVSRSDLSWDASGCRGLLGS